MTSASRALDEFERESWWEAALAEVNADPQWGEAAKYFPARIEFRGDRASWTIDTRDGRAVSVLRGTHPQGADITLAAPDAEWRRVIDGDTDWFRGTSPGLGQLTVEGDGVAAMRNVKAMWLLLGALSRTGKPAAEPGPYAPDPTPGRHTEVTGRYAEVGGLRTYYEEAGEGIPIVCIHAAGQDTLMYRHVVEGLSDEFRVISLDAPGHGKTLEPAGGAFRSISDHADFNEEFMAALGLENPVIVGCSMGGNMVLELAARRPDFYRAVISAEGSDYTPTVSDTLLEMLLLNGAQILEGWSQSMTGRRTPPQRAREVVWQLRRVCPEVIAADLTGYAGFDRRYQVGRIDSPVLLLRGDADWLVPQDMVEQVADRIPGSRIAVLEGTGHYPMIENPVEFNDTVRGFVKEAVR
ncbi:alpha/beta hydrolase [Streptomyces sp. NBC_01716]|uniref:alpha/beta hydrolase n=1 Tax=Streptomyces sp. NBC_01716 TaxID=2975917 RepID=UPI002E349703|nr:alpha/beta hydrolase [Streptomyces sp. NBC_01716]